MIQKSRKNIKIKRFVLRAPEYEGETDEKKKKGHPQYLLLPGEPTMYWSETLEAAQTPKYLRCSMCWQHVN